MSIPTTFRLNEPVQEALERFSKIRKTTKNKLVNEALERYLREEAETLADDLGEGGGVARGVAATRFLVDQRGDAETGFLSQKTLDGVAQLGAADWVEAAGAGQAGDLA